MRSRLPRSNHNEVGCRFAAFRLSSGLDWTIVQPGLLTNGHATGRYRVLRTSKDWRFSVISRADVADFLVRQIDDRALIGATSPLIGPQPRLYLSTLGSAT